MDDRPLADHLIWVRDRALVEYDWCPRDSRGAMMAACLSLLSDLRKHSETAPQADAIGRRAMETLVMAGATTRGALERFLGLELAPARFA